MRGRFSNPQHETERKALGEWHEGLRTNPGARARLRRAAGPDEVAFEPEFHQLLARLEPAFRVDQLAVRGKLAALAGLAARVREHSEEPLARQMAAAVSERRFRRLLTATSPDDRFAQLARVIQLLGGRVNLWSLADAVCDWDDPNLRQQWAYDYYQALSPDTEPRRP